MKNIFFILFISSITVYSQAPTIEWQKVYGGAIGETPNSICQTSDGGFILAGISFSMAGAGDITQNSVNNKSDIWIIKITSLGVKQWQRKIRADSMFDSRPKIKQTPDGGYIIGIDSDSGVGYDKTVPSKGASDYWILKLDSIGTIIWQKSIGGAGPESLSNLELTTDGGYIISGDSSSTASGDKTENRINNSNDYWIVKLDSIGNVVWDNTIGGNFNDNNPVVKPTIDGGYIVSGYSDSNSSVDKTQNSYGNYDYWVVKLDANGVVQWDKTIGGDYVDYSIWLVQSSDGNYYISGFSFSGVSGLKTEPNHQGDIWIVKLDSSGNILWENTIGGNYSEEFPYIYTTNDGGIIMLCNSVSDISGDKTQNNRGISVTTFTDQETPDYWMVKLDSNGIVQWDKTIGGNLRDSIFGNNVLQTSDGGFIVGGSSSSLISGDKTITNYGSPNFWILKLSPENLETNQTTLENSVVYPNPTNDIVNINFKEKLNDYTVKLSTIFGQQVLVKRFSQVANVTLEILGESGIYFLSIENENQEKKTFKIVKK